MANLIYSLYGDNKAAAVAPTISVGTEQSSFPITAAYDLNPAKPFRVTGTTLRMVWNFGSAMSIDWVPLINANLDAGLSGVVIQANNSNVWTGPSLSAAFTIPAKDSDGFPVDPWVDLTALTRSFQYWSFAVTVANTALVSIGEIGLIATKRSMPTNLTWPVTLEDDRPVTKLPVRGGGPPFMYDEGVRGSTIESEIDNTDANERTMRQWWLETHGCARPFFVVPDPSRNECRMVRWADTSRKVSQQVNDRNQVTLKFEIVDRGIAF